ncbi:hypothetical protein ABTJ37_21835, partial [Acinetobacter baumannii]
MNHQRYCCWPVSCKVVIRPMGPMNCDLGRSGMKRCDNLVDVGRRQFLSGAGAATAAAAAVA